MSPFFASVPVAVQRFFDKPLMLAVGLGMTLGLIPVISELVTMSSLPMQISGWFSLLSGAVIGFALIFSLVGLVPAMTLMFFRGTRRFAGRVWIACVSSIFLSLVSAGVSHKIREHGFREMAERTRPLIFAIKKFEKENKRAPAELEELVPKYISTIPSTGIGAYPEYRYERLEKDADPWELRVDCSSGMLNWDEFYYRPSEKYGERYGGWVEPMGSWAYFHE